jgi:hypothetical protein
MQQVEAPPLELRRTSGRVYAWLGLAALLLGLIAYLVQFELRILAVPWYTPVLGTAGVVLLLMALARKRTLWRWLGVVFVGLLTGFEWYFLLFLSVLPAYTGPVTAGQSFPAFTTTLADGAPFNQNDLKGSKNTALVFFRGRW